MAIPTLLNDYKKYLNIEKNPNKNFIDLSNIHFVAPASLLPIIYYAESNSINKYYFPQNVETSDHLKKILGISQSNTNLLPLVDIDLYKQNETSKFNQNNQKIGSLKKLKGNIYRMCSDCGISTSDYGGNEVFPYIIKELIRNIEQHSEANKVYSYCQMYPREGYMDIGILDNGVSIPGKYEQSRSEFADNDDIKINPYDFKNDCEAIYRSFNGISTKVGCKRTIKYSKTEEDIFESGSCEISFGINTCIRLITKGLGGSFLIASRGGICHLKSRKKNYLKPQPDDIIDGTFVCIRFKKLNLTEEEFKDIILEHSLIKDDSGDFSLFKKK